MNIVELVIEDATLACLDAMDYMMFYDLDIAVDEPGARLILEHTP
jgi:hypothetical protein